MLRENNEDVSLWQFSKGRTRRSVRVSAHLSCNDGDVIRQWACEGRGVILRSEWDVADDIAKGRLVRLLPGWKAPDADVMALTHQRAGLPARTRISCSTCRVASDRCRRGGDKHTNSMHADANSV